MKRILIATIAKFKRQTAFEVFLFRMRNISCYFQARSQDLEKGGGGYFERVRKVQTTLTRIFIVLETVSLGLSKNSDEISRKARKFEGFFRPKSGGLQKKKKKKKKKKVFAEIETDFLAEFRNSKVFSAQNQVQNKPKSKTGARKAAAVL